MNGSVWGQRGADLLLIDAKEYAHVLEELENFAMRIGNYLIIHIENKDNSDASWQLANSMKNRILTSKSGDSEWDLVPFENNSLMIFKRKVVREVPPLKKFSDAEKARIDQALKTKMVLCTGPSLRRGELLKKTTENDMKLMPFKKVFLSTNDPELQDITFNGKKPVCQVIPEMGHQLDCLNCILTSLKNVVADPEIDDDDIIVFKHETVFINDMNLVRSAIQKILDGAGMVVRYCDWQDTCMTDVFFAKVSTVREQFSQQVEITEFPKDSPFCEAYLTKRVLNCIPNIYWIHYNHRTRKDTELGFFHMPYKGEENWEGHWDKNNYPEFFNANV